MGIINIFEITLNNLQGIYYGGQTVVGHVTVELIAKMTVRGIRLRFIGDTHVCWDEDEPEYRSREVYFDRNIELFGKNSHQSGENPVLQPGRYTFPFEYQLPVNIPASFESSIGKIQYIIKGVIDRPWRLNHTTQKMFTVSETLNLNKEPMAVQSGQARDQKTLCCLCCKSGPISCIFRLNRLGYVPGEIIPIYGEITNGSRRQIHRTFARLYMVTKYYTKKHTKTERKDLSTIYHGPISPGDSDTWNGDRLLIPHVPPSGLRGCGIINISYSVTLNVDPSGLAFDLSVPLDVLIGTVPLRSDVQPQYGIPADFPSTSKYFYTST